MKNLRIKFLLSICYLLLTSSPHYAQQIEYFPNVQIQWESKAPGELGVDESRINSAVSFAQANEYSGPRDLRIAILEGFAREPYHEILGPVKERGGPAGIILKNGYIIAQWGDVKRVDMTFSVTKSYLSTLAGLALERGLIASLDDPVIDYVWDGTFDGDHNAKITWRHLLNQSSDWSGSLWGGHDWADRPPRDGGIDDWKNRIYNTPGSVFEYNDVRVNVLAYALLHVWRKPLPQVLKEEIMDPIGASPTWRWFGYNNSWTEIDGLKVQSVSGGGHSGGGLFINTLDQARMGLLFLNNGKWKDNELFSSSWIETITEPSEAEGTYGLMWWLNKEGDRQWQGVSENVFYAAGFGGNYIVIDEENSLVIVTRWLEPVKMGEFVEMITAAQ